LNFLERGLAPEEGGEEADSGHILRVLLDIEERSESAHGHADQPHLVIALRPRGGDHILAQADDDRAIRVVPQVGVHGHHIGL
jgi:hypothetical protein